MLAGISESLWLGYGWRRASAAEHAVADLIPHTEHVDYAHHFVLDLMVWAGAPLGLLIATVIIVWVKRRLHEAQKVESVFAMAMLIPLLVHSQLEYPYAYAYFLFPAGIWTGIVERQSGKSRVIEIPKFPFLTLYVTLLVYLSLLCNEYFVIEKEFVLLRSKIAKIGQNPIPYEESEIKILGYFDDLRWAMETTAKPNMSAKEIARLRRTLMRFTWPPLHFRYILALGLNGQVAEASLEMQKLRGLFGELHYEEAKNQIYQLAQKSYPQLTQISTP
jgi:hypothetical protein